MPKKIYLDGQCAHVSRDDLPLLIHGIDGEGASLFSVSVIADLYNQGEKVLFTSGYHMARDEFKAQTNAENDTILVNNESDIAEAITKRVIFVPFEQPELFKKLIDNLPDMPERIVFLKNFELFDATIFEKVRQAQNYVLQGDLNICTYLENITSAEWASKIYFSKPPSSLNASFPKLQKYTGYLTGNRREGVVSLT